MAKKRKDPATQEPAAGEAAAKPHQPDKPAKGTGASTVDKRVVAGVAGIAVGSAAIAAALLFAGRTSKPKSAAISPPPPKTPLPAAPIAPAPISVVPDASAIDVAKAD